jgi:DNA polymerase-1
MSAPSPRLFLIDGYALIYRAFFAMIARPLTTSHGENTSAAWGVANFLLRLSRRHAPEHVAWVHDAGTSFRHEVYPAYKATREKLEPALQEAFDRSVERVRQLLAAFRVPLVALDGYEADDVIGTLAQRAAARGWQVVIVSGDKDFYQLVAPGIGLLNPGRGGPAAVDEQWVDETNATERLGVPPERVVDYLALVGDASDNVPGVRGIGDKTARQLIEQFGDLDAILARAGEASAKRAREALAAHAAEARLSRDLVTIRRDLRLDVSLDALTAAPPDVAALTALFSELEFHSLVPQIASAVDHPPPSMPTSDAPVVSARPDAIPRDGGVVCTVAELSAVTRALRAGAPIGLLTVVEGADRLRAALVGMALATRDGAWYLPFGHRAPSELGATEPMNLPAPGSAGLGPIADVLQDAAVSKVAHDAKAELLTLRTAGITLRGVIDDTMLSIFVLEPGRRSYALDQVVVDRLGAPLPSLASLQGTGRNARPVAELAPDDVGPVVVGLARSVLRLREGMAPKIDTLGLRALVRDVELPLVRVLADMEWRGIAVDTARLAALSRMFAGELAELERQIYADAGTDFNINSTPQLRHVLYEKLQLPVLKKTKTGPSTDADVLAALAEMGFSTPTLLLEYRELAKLRSTYVDVLPTRVNPATGRIHTTFNQAGAATGRLSSLEPNLQNIPVRTRRGEEIRRCFVAPPGCRLIVADYSQIELRVLAHLSGDEAFVAAFRRGGDIHRETAAIIFNTSVSDVTPEMRARAKTINFATIYGQGAFSLSRQLGISQDEAREFIATYFTRFAGVRRFLDETVERARAVGYVETIFGRRRYIPELKDRNRSVQAFGERTAMNSPMQGSAADIIKVAMIGLAQVLGEGGYQSGMLLQVHDELVLEAPDDEVQAVSALVRQHMEGATTLAVPLVVDIGIGDNWLDAKR